MYFIPIDWYFRYQHLKHAYFSIILAIRERVGSLNIEQEIMLTVRESISS